MDQFKNEHESHDHSLSILNLLYEYDDFMDNLRTIVDMGCGAGMDSKWWATLYDREDPPNPHNYTVYGVDRNVEQVDPTFLDENPNLFLIRADIERVRLPKKADLIWCHDVFQSVINPLATLATWNQLMNVNGMLILSIPQHTNMRYNRLVTRSYSGCYYQHNLVGLMYMLAVNGFDCNDCFMQKQENDPWINIAVYKSQEPMDPATTTWHDLIKKELVSPSAANSIARHGYVKQEDLITRWLDKDFYFVKD